MGRQIKMYNAYFGDCFVIQDSDINRNLVVDCGIREVSPAGSNGKSIRKKQLEDIQKNLRDSYDQRDLLITHFHYDHISGLTKLLKDPVPGLTFDKVYLPNIWDFPFVVASTLLQQNLLKIMLKKSKVSAYGTGTEGLLDLLIALGSCTNNVRVLKRGDNFENDRYVTLLPNDDILNKIDEEYQNIELPPELGNLKERVSTVANDVSVLVAELVDNSNEGQLSAITVSLIEQRNRMNTFIDELTDTDISDDTIDLISLALDNLNKPGNRISIVFQNKESDDYNLLFTGDAEKGNLITISTKTDIKMHDHYKYIKLPHHGTKTHFFDFAPYTPEYVLIPNGSTKFNDEISSLYKDLGYNKICSNSDHCACSLGGCGSSLNICTSSKKDIVFPDLFKIV